MFPHNRWCINYPRWAAGVLMYSGALGTLWCSLLPPLMAGSIYTLWWVGAGKSSRWDRLTRFAGLGGKCWREGTVSVQWENKGHKPGEKWGLLKNWETRALGSGTPGLWTFAPVSILLEGCQFLPNTKEAFTLTLVLECSLWYFRGIELPCWDPPLFWRMNLPPCLL